MRTTESHPHLHPPYEKFRLLGARQPLPLSPPPPAHTLQTSDTSHPRQIQGARAGGGRSKLWAQGGISHAQRGSVGVSAPGLHPPSVLLVLATPVSPGGRKGGGNSGVFAKTSSRFYKVSGIPPKHRRLCWHHLSQRLQEVRR